MKVDTITHIMSAMTMYLGTPSTWSVLTTNRSLSTAVLSSIGVFNTTLIAPLSGPTYVTTMSAIPVSGFINISAIAETLFPFVSAL